MKFSAGFVWVGVFLGAVWYLSCGYLIAQLLRRRVPPMCQGNCDHNRKLIAAMQEALDAKFVQVEVLEQKIAQWKRISNSIIKDFRDVLQELDRYRRLLRERTLTLHHSSKARLDNGDPAYGERSLRVENN